MEKNLLSIYNEMINQLDNVWKGEKILILKQILLLIYSRSQKKDFLFWINIKKCFCHI